MRPQDGPATTARCPTQILIREQREISSELQEGPERGTERQRVSCWIHGGACASDQKRPGGLSAASQQLTTVPGVAEEHPKAPASIWGR